MKRNTQQRRLTWNLRQMSSAYALNLAFTRVNCRNNVLYIVIHPSGSNLQLEAETCEFSQVPSLSMGVHGTLMCLILSVIN